MTASAPTKERSLILVVDDDEAGRYTKTHTLRHAGFEVIEAWTGADALRLISERSPQLILLDVNLPDVSGWDVCRRIKESEETKTLPVLQMSASYVTEADTVRALEGGADACLTEPVEPPVLVATVRALLRTRRAEEAVRAALAREQAARAAAEAASRTKDEFLATLSHELRSPLNAILTWVSLARTDRLDNEKKQHALEVIERNTRLQVKMIEELLDVSRIVSGKMRLDVEVFDLTPVVEAARESIQPAADKKGVHVSSVIDASAGPVSGDPARVQQIVSNLLSNAVKFTPKDGKVDLRVGNAGSEAVIAVEDTGRGIDPVFLPFIFDRFRQADASTTRSEGGLGLGLAIVRHLVDLHGGSVAAASHGLGKGATFTVRLPIAPATSERVPRTFAIAPSGIRSSAKLTDLDGLRILLLDDEADAREVISVVLEECGASVTQASSVADALELLSSDVPDVIVSDIAMPIEDGYSFVRRVRAASSEEVRRLPVIALTAYSSAEDRRRILEAGFDVQLAKPIEPRELTATVRALAQRAGK